MFESPEKMARSFLLFSALLLFCATVTTSGDEHSLFYTYTALSKPVNLPGIYEFIALGTLDDRELDYYNSQTQEKVPKQKWMKEKMAPDYWVKGTQSRQSKEQWFKVNVEILMNRMEHNKTDLHTLQWRHGCVIDVENGDSKFIRGIDEYSYDGAEFLSFDELNSRWIAPVQAAESTKRKWDGVDILNQYTKSYLQKECVDWLTKFMDYGQEELKQHSLPDVHLFAKKSVKDSKKLILTCLATGFYPKDVEVCLRKGRTSIPKHLLTSSGVRPNGDGTYQLRKSLEILEEEKALYDCFVNHTTLKAPIIVSPGKDIPCLDCSAPVLWGMIGGLLAGILLTTVVIAGVIFFLIRTNRIAWGRNSRPSAGSPASPLGCYVASLPVIVPVPAPAPAQEISDSEDGKFEPDCGTDSGAETAEESQYEESDLLPGAPSRDSDSAAGSCSGASQQSNRENTDHEQIPML